MSVHLNNDDEFTTLVEQGVRSQKPIVLKFGATWCGPCKHIAPKFEQLAKHHAATAIFASVDIDELDSVAAAFKVNSVPAFFVLKNHDVVDRCVGGDPVRLEHMVKKHCAEVQNQ